MLFEVSMLIQFLGEWIELQFMLWWQYLFKLLSIHLWTAHMYYKHKVLWKNLTGFYHPLEMHKMPLFSVFWTGLFMFIFIIIEVILLLETTRFIFSIFPKIWVNLPVALKQDNWKFSFLTLLQFWVFVLHVFGQSPTPEAKIYIFVMEDKCCNCLAKQLLWMTLNDSNRLDIWYRVKFNKLQLWL